MKFNWRLLFGQLALIIFYLGLYTLIKWNPDEGYLGLLLLGVGLAIGLGAVYMDANWAVQQYSEPASKLRPITRSIVVLLALIPIGIFTVTSTASLLSMGFFFGFSGGIVAEMLTLYKKPEDFRQLYAWQVSKSLSDEASQWIVTIAVMVLGIFTILFVW